MKMTGLELTSIDSGLLEVGPENYSFVNEQLTFSLSNVNPISLEKGTLFTLNFTANQSNELHNLMAISEDKLRAEAYQGNGIETIGLTLSQTAIESFEFGLAQNEPNPWLGETTIEFTLPEAGVANLTIYDVTGKQLYYQTGNYEKGTSSITVKEKDIAGSNTVLYYKIDSGNNAAVKKMIMFHD